MNDRAQLGKFGEMFALQYLTGVLGWSYVTRNWRCKLGELDLILQDGDCLVVVEVRTRSHVEAGEVIHAVDAHKVRQLRRVVPFALKTFGRAENARVDVVALRVDGRTVSELIHLRNVSLCDG